MRWWVDALRHGAAWESKTVSAKAHDYWEEHRAANETAEAKAQADYDALVGPADKYRIVKNFETGVFEVRQWKKRIHRYEGMAPVYLGGGRVVPGFPATGSAEASYELLRNNLPTHKAAEAWLRAHLDPTTNLTAYDAEGRRIEDPS